MVYAGGQHLSFYRPWLLLTRICHPQNPHVSPPVLFYRSCRESDPTLLPEQACIEATHVACLVAQFIYVHMKAAGVSHGPMQKEARGTSEAKQAQGKTWSSIMPAENTCSGHSSGPVLWCMQGVRPCHFIDPGFCQPACVTPKTRICHPLCHFMVYAGGQHLSFYRPWLLPTRMCRPHNPHLSPLVPFYGVCRGSTPVIL